LLVFQDKGSIVRQEIFSEGARPASMQEVSTFRLFYKTRQVELQGKTVFNLPADAGFLCDNVSATVAMLKDTINQSPSIYTKSKKHLKWKCQKISYP
jgi:hypothetical protein